jgi:hypothetical protein
MGPESGLLAGFKATSALALHTMSQNVKREMTPLKKPKIVSGLSGLSRFCFIFIRFICLIR